jgi:hypothetical protein
VLTKSTLSASPQQPKPTRLTTRDLTKAERHLVQLMAEVQFGRFENLHIRAGQPILNDDARVVRVARLGCESDNTPIAYPEQFELKKQVRTLFAELARLENGVVVRLEFRHGLPHLIEVRSDAFLKPIAT